MPAAPATSVRTPDLARGPAPPASVAGLTLIELIVAFSLMLILSLMALPVAQVKVSREKERRLREALHEIRQAIDRHKDMADAGRLGMLDPDNHGYPESLEALVEGVTFQGQPGAQPTSSPGIGLEPSRAMIRDQDRLGGIGSDSRSAGAFGTRGRTGIGSMSEQDAGSERDEPETIRFLRSIPVDPMTGKREWGLLSVSDDPRAKSWSGRNVFDVYSLSGGIALDGTQFSDW